MKEPENEKNQVAELMSEDAGAKTYDPLDPAQQNVSEGLRALEAAYTSPQVSLSMIIVGAVIVAALAGILVALVLFSGATQ